MDFKVSTNTDFNNYKLKRNNDNKDVSFKSSLSPVSTFMNLAANSDAFNTTFVDVVGMVTPRTYIDTKRNKYAGAETLTRELTATFTNCIFPGLLAFGVAAVMKPFVGVETKLLANDDTIDLLKTAWNNAAGEGTTKTKNYVKNVLEDMKGLDGDKWTEWKNIKNNQKVTDEIADDLAKLIENKSQKGKEGLKLIEDKIGQNLKARNKIELSIGKDNAKKTLSTSLDFLVRDMRDMGKHVFTEVKAESMESAIKKLKGVNKGKTVAALGTIGVVDFVSQYINRRLTNKKTGKKGFVGYTDYESQNTAVEDPNKKAKLNIGKGLALAALGTLAFITMKPEKGMSFLKSIQFQKKSPTLNQVRFLFSTTVAGRIVASDDANELRESCTRDLFSFVNWLILGNFVTKGIVYAKDKKLINYSKNNLLELDESKKLKGLKRFAHWISDTSVKTHTEVLDMGLDAADQAKKLGILNKATGAGLAYSTLMLGIGIPVLNMVLTNRSRAKELAAQKAQENKNPATVKNASDSAKANTDIFATYAKLQKA